MKYNLSEISEVIRNRRTIYPEDYSSRKVHEEIVRNVLTNGTWAPTHGMTQPWRFTVFSENGRQKLADFLSDLYAKVNTGDKYKPSKHDRMKTRPLAASVIVAVSMARDPERRIPELEEIEAVACCIQNMALTATAYGIGSFWATPGIIARAEMNEFLGLGPEDRCLGLFYMGYPSNPEWPRSHRKPLEFMTQFVKD
jgi:nitroreductase